MTKYIVYQWNGHQWTLDNSVHAMVRTGPYDSWEEADAAVGAADAEAVAEGYERCYVRNRTTVMQTNFPIAPPLDTL